MAGRSDELKGGFKEGLGKLTGDEAHEAEGTGQKQAGHQGDPRPLRLQVTGEQIPVRAKGRTGRRPASCVKFVHKK